MYYRGRTQIKIELFYKKENKTTYTNTNEPNYYHTFYERTI